MTLVTRNVTTDYGLLPAPELTILNDLYSCLGVDCNFIRCKSFKLVHTEIHNDTNASSYYIYR